MDNFGIHSPGFMISVIACASVFGLYVAPMNKFYEVQPQPLRNEDQILHDAFSDDRNGSVELTPTEIV